MCTQVHKDLQREICCTEGKRQRRRDTGIAGGTEQEQKVVERLQNLGGVN